MFAEVLRSCCVPQKKHIRDVVQILEEEEDLKKAKKTNE
jgi:hypothetical protein